ncbi:hypothetical protein GCM10010282_31630 [Streptomyces roseolus]|nr:hypothetical protein GCM10010282_31630 [Streptomyces roseolus]
MADTGLVPWFQPSARTPRGGVSKGVVGEGRTVPFPRDPTGPRSTLTSHGRAIGRRRGAAAGRPWWADTPYRRDPSTTRSAADAREQDGGRCPVHQFRARAKVGVEPPDELADVGEGGLRPRPQGGPVPQGVVSQPVVDGRDGDDEPQPQPSAGRLVGGPDQGGHGRIRWIHSVQEVVHVVSPPRVPKPTGTISTGQWAWWMRA